MPRRIIMESAPLAGYGGILDNKKGASMPDGGFVVRINGKEVSRCYAIAFDYDEWQYTINNKETKKLPEDTESIAIEIE